MFVDSRIRRIAIVGTGVIGASWAAQFPACGFDAMATDPAPNAGEKKAVSRANLTQENAPEPRDFKSNPLADLDSIAMSGIQFHCKHPERSVAPHAG